MNKRLEDIAEELRDLKEALSSVENVIDAYLLIDWPSGVNPPHHVEMEMEEARSEIDGRIQEIEYKLERI